MNVSTFEWHLKQSDTSLVRYIRTAPTTRFVNPSVVVSQMAYNTFNQTNGRLIRMVRKLFVLSPYHISESP